jgi:hypothetical protein
MLGETLAPFLPRALAAAALTLGLAGAAHAEDTKVYPATMCLASGGDQGALHHGETSVANQSAAAAVTAICPLVRDNVTLPWERLVVAVFDRHSTQDICCKAQANDPYGFNGSSSAWICSSGTGTQNLSFDALAPGTEPLGPYSVLCQIPAKEAGTPASLITSYRLLEP